MVIITDTINVPKKRGRPPKPKPDTQQTIQSTHEIKSTDSPSPEKRVYNIRSIFKELAGITPYIDYKVKSYTLDDIERFLANPIQYSTQLADICQHFYAVYGFFRELIQYYVEPVLYRWTVNTVVTNPNFMKLREKTDKTSEKVEKDFITYTARINSLGLNRELWRILLKAHLEDVYFGYWLENGDSISLYEFPQTWCILSGKANGNWTYKLNTSRIGQRDIDKLPKEIASLVNKYKGKSGEEAYAPVPIEKSLCIKYNDGVPHILCPFIFAIQLVVDLIKEKQLGLLRSESDTTNLIEMLVPSSKDQHDDILFTDPIIKQYAEGLTDLVGNSVAILPTPMKLEVLPTSKSTASEKNTVKNAIENFGEETNMPSFGGVDTGAMVKRSLEFAQSKVFTLLDQLSNVINLKMKADGLGVGNGYEFKYEILHMNEFNQYETQDELLKQAQAGAINKFRLEAARGNNPMEVLGNHYMENVLYRDMWMNAVLPMSSHTQSSNSDGGRPLKKETDLTDSGVQSREDGVNDKERRDT